MRVLRGFPGKAGARGRVLTLGVFDGVHRGHARLIASLRRIADAQGWRSTVVTFSAHPHGTISPQHRPPELATRAQCLERFRHLGVEETIVVPFTKRLAKMPAEKFVRSILLRHLGVRHVVVGSDFVFGARGLGNVRTLRRWGRLWGFGVTVVPPLMQAREKISSTRIRAWVAAGQMTAAGRALGWPYTLHGVVVKGEGRGTAIGLATANLRTRHELVPPSGIYAVKVRIGASGRVRPALCHIGLKPTFQAAGPETIEVHIPGFGRILYGRCLAVAFYRRLRAVRKFPSSRALLHQVAEDWQLAQASFKPTSGVKPGRTTGPGQIAVKPTGADFRD